MEFVNEVNSVFIATIVKNSDKNIWEDFKNGKDYALEHIYSQHVQLLFSYGKKFSNDHGLIKDTIQDLFFDLIRTRKKLGKTDNIKYYLITSFRRKLIRHMNKQKCSFQTQREKFPESGIVDSAEQNLIDKEELTYREELVQKTLKELSPCQREILFYRFTCDLEYDQVCEIMELKYDTARKMVYRALQTLKGQLGKL